jgi:hypothetical protein
MRTVSSHYHSPSTSATSTSFDAGLPRHGGRTAARSAPYRLRLKVYLTQGRLDRQIAAGYPCEAAPELALRAKNLTDPRTQQKIARNLRGVVRYVDRMRPHRGISSVVISPRAVRSGRRAICELAEQLERAAPVNPRGIVLAQSLLTDGTSPFFNPHSEQTVAEAVRETQEALGDTQPSSPAPLRRRSEAPSAPRVRVESAHDWTTSPLPRQE